jgi:DNA modification methylase
VITVGGAVVYVGDCREQLKHLADNSVDSVVTDPPYELGFMGKSWDSTGIAYDVTVWLECLRVLKPGGHILAFGGSRTWHRLAVAVEDAGFELRDSIAWIYGSGFPKSLDVSKAIDKGQGVNRDRQLQFTAWMRSTGITAEQINEATGTAMASHYLTEKSQPAIATADLFDKLRPYLPQVPEYIERLVAERTGIEWTEYKNRKVIGPTVKGAQKTSTGRFGAWGDGITPTAAATPEASKWQGWGTALKPAFEPVVVGRKPFGKGVTVAENVLLWGVGGLNIDGSRIGNSGGTARDGKADKPNDSGWENMRGHGIAELNAGRWPANVILDEVTAGLLDEQSGVSVSRRGELTSKPGDVYGSGKGLPSHTGVYGHNDTGGASRFFYQAKASKRDRNEGLEELEAIRHADRVVDDGPGGENPRNRTNQAKQNFHPTVKPTQLMRYLIKLVTPEGGVVLDPFTGSGSTGKAALLDGFKFVGVELTAEYLPIIEGRLRWAMEQEGETDGETLF